MTNKCDYDGTKKYQVFVIDYWDNIYETYFVNDLKDAEEALNEFFDSLGCTINPDSDEERAGLVPHFGDGETDYQLCEVVGTMSVGINTIYFDCDDGGYQVRGFVLR